MTDKINHYSLTTPASIYDEEAMTALELAGRTAQKVNECVDEVNQIPDKVEKAVVEHIQSGDFADAIDTHIGNLEDRLDNLVQNTPEGATTMDLEVLDMRVASDGTTYGSAGESLREQVDNVPKVGTLTLYKNGCVEINTVSQTVASTYTMLLFAGKRRITVPAFAVSYVSVGATAFYVVWDLTENGVKCVPYASYNGKTQVVMWAVNLNALTFDTYALSPYIGTYYVDGKPMSSDVHYGQNIMLKDYKITFDTTAKTVKTLEHLYVCYGSKTWTLAPFTCTWDGLTGNRFYIVLNLSAGEVDLIPVSEYTSDYVILFQIQTNYLTEPTANNIPCGYVVDGAFISRSGGSGKGSEDLTVYVDPEGSDTQDGAKERPFRTIQRAINEGATTIYVKNGTYVESFNVSDRETFRLLGWSETYTQDGTSPVATLTPTTPCVIKNVKHLVMERIKIDAQGQTEGDALLIEEVADMEIRRCEFDNAPVNGLACVNASGMIVHCVSNSNYNDGFNFHGHGVTDLVECEAHGNMDDGVSHHDSCSGTVIGGRFVGNDTTGICPSYGAHVNIRDVLVKQSLNGILFYSDTAITQESLVTGCVIVNCTNGIKSKNYPVTQVNNTFNNCTLKTDNVFTVTPTSRFMIEGGWYTFNDGETWEDYFTRTDGLMGRVSGDRVIWYGADQGYLYTVNDDTLDTIYAKPTDKILDTTYSIEYIPI